MMRRGLALAALLLGTTAFASGALDLYAPWKYVKTVTITDGDTARVAAPLDSDVIRHGRPDLADLRLITADGTSVPYAVVSGGTAQSAALDGTIRDYQNTGGRIAFIVDLGETAVLSDRLDLSTVDDVGGTWRRSATLASADRPLPLDDAAWRPLGVETPLYHLIDERSGLDVQNQMVRYAPSAARYIRVILSDGQGRPSVIGARAFLAAGTGTTTRMSLSRNVRVVHDADARTTALVLSTGDAGIVSDTIQLGVSGEGDFLRDAVVEGGDDGLSWEALGTGALFRVEGVTSLSLQFTPTKARFLRVRVRDGDDTPLRFLPQATVSGERIRMIFDRPGVSSLYLLYGNASAALPQYDISRLAPVAVRDTLGVAELSAEDTFGGVATATPALPGSLWERLTNILLVVIALILSMMILGHLKRLKLTDHHGGPSRHRRVARHGAGAWRTYEEGKDS